MSKQILHALCRMPIVFHERGDVSMVDLVKECGYGSKHQSISEADLEAHLRGQPTLLRAWLRYSEDQRCSPAWYLAPPGTGPEWSKRWSVGCYPADENHPERLFQDEFGACAFFIMRNVESLTAGQPAAAADEASPRS